MWNYKFECGPRKNYEYITLNSQLIPACLSNEEPACPASNNTVLSAVPWNHKIGAADILNVRYLVQVSICSS